MTAAGLQDLIIKETQQLPFAMQNEVLDFILFLKNKYARKIDNELSQLQSDELQHLDQEFADYKKQYPHE